MPDTPFDRAFKLLLTHEGGHVDDAQDPGGETKYGISARAYPQIDIPALTPDKAKRIYRRDYWEVARCDELSWIIAWPLFDGAVNMGAARAVTLMQGALNVARDGVFGARTMSALQAHPAKRDLLALYMAERAVFYAGLKGWPRFGRGWMRRLMRVQGEALVEANAPRGDAPVMEIYR